MHATPEAKKTSKSWRALVLLLGVLSCRPTATPSDPDPLIPFERFFAQASYDAPRISPDGEHIVWMAPLDGVTNLFVAPTEDLEAARPLTRETERGLQPRDVSGVVMYRFSRDGRYVVFPKDTNGDENWNLYAVSIDSAEVRNLTQLDEGRAELLRLSDEDPTKALVGVSANLLSPPDLFAVDLETGERKMVAASGGYLGYVADNTLKPRVALAWNAEGGIDYLTAKPDSSRPEDFELAMSVGPDDIPAVSASGYQKIVRVDRANELVYFYDSRDRDTIALVEMDLATGETRHIASDERVDVGGVLYHPTEHVPQAYAVNWTRKRWVAIDDDIAGDLAFLEQASEGDLDVVSRSHDDRRWIVRFTLAHEPQTYSLYERTPVDDQPGQLTELFVTTPELEGLRLSKMHPVVIPSRDGLDLVSYLSFPPWLDGGDGRPSKPVPLVMLVHGGPSDERAQYAFGPFVHWLTNRGYGVFYVNYRGSPGFGKAFVNAQRLEWGGKMHDDLVDQAEWAIGEGVTTREQIAILGGSYGGYATLVGMTITPDVFACGVDLVGPSNLEIFMPHWDVDVMSKIIGDPRTEEGLELLRARSPINFAHQAKHPILIGQGANDSRVPQDQSDSMVDVFVENGVEVTYLLYPDEGHGFLRPENNRSFWAIAEVFLAECLGGRAEPLTDQLSGSSAQVVAGAEHIPGLAEALARRETSAD